VQLCSAFFPPDSSHHFAEQELLVRFKQGRGPIYLRPKDRVRSERLAMPTFAQDA
jgi:hypothetical protein